MAVDNDHYQFLLALEEGRITEKQYDKWVHSRKHEGPFSPPYIARETEEAFLN